MSGIPSSGTKSVRSAALFAALLKHPLSLDSRTALQSLASILSEVGARAAQIDDERLNELMARLGIYSVPESDRVAMLQWRKQHPMAPKAEIERLRRGCLVRRYLHLRAKVAGSVFTPAKARQTKQANLNSQIAKKARRDAAAGQQ